MRISDWSSDVCSSDLRVGNAVGAGPYTGTVLRQALVSGRVRMRARRFLLHGLLALLVATGASGMGAYAQTPPADGVRMPVTLPDSEVWRIRSEGSGLEYQIMVAWPDYPPPERSAEHTSELQ